MERGLVDRPGQGEVLPGQADRAVDAGQLRSARPPGGRRGVPRRSFRRWWRPAGRRCPVRRRRGPGRRRRRSGGSPRAGRWTTRACRARPRPATSGVGPGARRRGRSSGVRDQVASTTTSATSAGAGTTSAGRAAARDGSRSVATIRDHWRRWRRPARVVAACAPAPTKPSVSAAGGASVWVASAAARPVRQAVTLAESSSASSSPSARACRQTTPRSAGVAAGNLALTFTVYAGTSGSRPGIRHVAVPGPGRSVRIRSGGGSAAAARKPGCQQVQHRVEVDGGRDVAPAKEQGHPASLEHDRHPWPRWPGVAKVAERSVVGPWPPRSSSWSSSSRAMPTTVVAVAVAALVVVRVVSRAVVPGLGRRRSALDDGAGGPVDVDVVLDAAPHDLHLPGREAVLELGLGLGDRRRRRPRPARSGGPRPR